MKADIDLSRSTQDARLLSLGVTPDSLANGQLHSDMGAIMVIDPMTSTRITFIGVLSIRVGGLQYRAGGFDFASLTDLDGCYKRRVHLLLDLHRLLILHLHRSSTRHLK